jgi:hypothetical protein
MTHHEIEQQDIIERYVRHQLKPDERRAFQEHYFACDECFAAVESTAKFIAGVQRSARVGVLAEQAREVTSVAPWWDSFFQPIFALSALACLLLAVAIGWLVLRPTPETGGPSAQTSPTPKQLAQDNTTATPTPTAVPKATPDSEDKPSRKDLDDKIARNETPTPRPTSEPKGNVVVYLESARDSGAKASSVKISPDLATLTLRTEVEPDRTITYEMQIFDGQGRSVKTLGGLRASASGALSASVPAKSFTAGKYRVKLLRLKNRQRELAGDFEVTLRN